MGGGVELVELGEGLVGAAGEGAEDEGRGEGVGGKGRTRGRCLVGSFGGC